MALTILNPAEWEASPDHGASVGPRSVRRGGSPRGVPLVGADPIERLLAVVGARIDAIHDMQPVATRRGAPTALRVAVSRRAGEGIVAAIRYPSGAIAFHAPRHD